MMNAKHFASAYSGKTLIAMLLIVVCISSCLLMLARATEVGDDLDGDGINDKFERFFGLDVGVDDSAADPDMDGLDNLGEGTAWTDPFSSDTDLDGWTDGIDKNPVSRAVYLWGEPRFTLANTNLYVRPSWASFGLAEGGELSVAGSNDCAWALSLPEDRLLMHLNRSVVSNDLWLAVAASGPVSVGLLDSNLVALTPLVPLEGSIESWQTNRLPLSAWPAAEVIALQATQGMARVSVSVLYSEVYDDSDNDGMPDAWEVRNGLNPGDPSDAAADPDGDGISNLREYELNLDPARFELDPATAVPGLIAEFFSFGSQNISVLPSLDGLVPDMVRVDTNINYASTSAAWTGLDSRFVDRFASRHTGFLRVGTADSYTFYLNSDDGSKLWVDGALVIDNDGLHGMREYSAARTLAAGDHAVRVEFFESTSGAGLVFSWAGPGFSKQVVPSAAFRHISTFGVTPPLVKLTQPVSGAVYGEGNRIALAADAWAVDGAVDRVSFLVNGAETGVCTHAPYGMVWTNLVAGTYGLSAVATGNDGLSRTSAVVNVTVLPPPDGYAYGLKAQFFDFPAGLSAQPDLKGRTPDVARIDDQINYPYTTNVWEGLPLIMADTFASRHYGWLAVPASGTYTFYLNSDDGSKLWIDGGLVVDNGGMHGLREYSATRTLTAGNHAIRVEFCESSGGAGLVLGWSGPGFSKRTVEPTALLHPIGDTDADNDGMPDDWEIFYGLNLADSSDASADADGDGITNLRECVLGLDPARFDLDPEKSAPGLLAEFFTFGTQTLSALPALDGRMPDVMRIDGNINYASTGAAWAGLDSRFLDHFVSRHSGYLRIRTAGSYTFYLSSDDGSKLWIDGELVIGNDGLQSMGEKSATRTLAAGDHTIRVEYFENTSLAGLILNWAGPGISKQVIPADVFLHVTGAIPPLVSVTQPAGAVYGEGNRIAISASAWDLDGSVGQVTLLVNGEAVGTCVSAPYSAVWTNLVAGVYGVTALATDDDGLSRTSAVVNVTVLTPPPGYAYGVNTDFYDFTTNNVSMPCLDGRTSTVTRVDDQVNYAATTNAWAGLPCSMTDTFASRHDGWLLIETSGTYTFYLSSDDGSKLWLDDKLIINNDGSHGMREYSTNCVFASGVHRLRVDFFENSVDAGLVLSWAGPGFAKRVIETTAFLRLTGNPDTDGDGMPDWWELRYGLDPNTAATANLDTDGDGLTDLQEYQTTGTNPAKRDTDDDGMPDKWEIDNVTDPFVFDSWGDPDRDGLCNLDEFLAGTNPHKADTDGDGVSDCIEALTAFTDPNAVDFDGTRTQVGSLVAGASFNAATGGWVAENGSACARERCGSLIYTLEAPNPAAHALAVKVTQWNRYTAQDTFDLSLEVDGIFCGRITVYAAYGAKGEALFFLPALASGSHSFRLVWRNNNANTFLQVDSLAFVRLGGPDVDVNGEPDWFDNRLSNLWESEPVADTSLVSPVCIEGAGRFAQTVSVLTGNSLTQTVGTVSQGVGDRWFVDVSLDPVGDTSVTFEGLQDGTPVSFPVKWEALNLSDPVTNAVLLRCGDSLLLGSVTNTTVVVTCGGQSVTSLTVTAAAPVPFAFGFPGDYLVSAVPEGTQDEKMVAVRAVSRDLMKDSYAMLIGKQYDIGYSELPAELAIEHDERLSVGLTATQENACVVSMLTYSDKQMGMVMRLQDGPVLDATAIIPIYADNGGYWQAIRVYPDGTRLVEGALRLGAVPAGLTVVLKIFVSGVTFEDGTLEKILTAADFDADGVCRYRFLQSADCTTSVCHTTSFYQNGVLLGSL